MKTIWKYPLDITDAQVLDIPMYSEPLSVGSQDGKLVLWVLVDPDNDLRPCTIWIRGTGHDAMGLNRRHFVGTAQMDGFVWHVFWWGG